MIYAAVGLLIVSVLVALAISLAEPPRHLDAWREDEQW